MQERKFDLNIEEILEDWDIHHGIREVIANAIDEQIITQSKDVEIYKDERGRWHIRDFGRGIKYQHFTQNEDNEKLSHDSVIGKFGIGLKDALATFDRRKVEVLIKSKFGDISLGKSSKYNFGDIKTLHAIISQPSETNMIGTDFILSGFDDEYMSKAKNLFLMFSGEPTIEHTNFGTVLGKKGDVARIYINGVKVSEEEDFLFSYNITSLTKKIRQALNRERSNVGRSAYSNRIKTILLNCESTVVAENLVKDLENYSSGVMHDELGWIDVQEHAVKILNSKEKVVFLTSHELIENQEMVDEAKEKGYKIVTIPDTLKRKIQWQKDDRGEIIRDFDQFVKEYQDSFSFDFIDPMDLSEYERSVFKLKDKIFSMLGGKPVMIEEIRISERTRIDVLSDSSTSGVWEPNMRAIIIHRRELSNIESFAGTLLHEIAHAISNAPDVNRKFEMELTRLLGKIVKVSLDNIDHA
jgi:hypothetical protein